MFLRCVLCDRQQTAGLLSGAGWHAVAVPTGADVRHPALARGVARACPTCVATYQGDWQQRVLAALGPGAELRPAS